MELDVAAPPQLPKPKRQPEPRAKASSKAKAKASSTPKEVIDKNPKNLGFDLPAGLTMADCFREKHSTGHFVCWRSCRNELAVIGKLSVWGRGFENVSMQCKVRGHANCKRAGRTRDLQKEDMEAWLFSGINLKDASAHMGLPM